MDLRAGEAAPKVAPAYEASAAAARNPKGSGLKLPHVGADQTARLLAGCSRVCSHGLSVMRKSRRRTSRKAPKQQPVPPKRQPPAPSRQAKQPWLIARKLLAFTMAAATLIAVPGALLVLLPRITVEGTGDFSKPASIAFVTTNIGSIPLRYPTVGMFTCEVAYIREPDTQPRACNLSLIPPSVTNAKSQEWLNVDDKITTRWEDAVIAEGGAPIVRANLIIIVGYYPWYSPVRFYKRFGFRSAKGSDGILYWRAYSL
jgi:hypothetical protein